MGNIIERELSHSIIACFYRVYNTLGYGHPESVYRNAMMVEFARRGINAVKEPPIEVIYEGVPVGFFRPDIVVEG